MYQTLKFGSVFCHQSALLDGHPERCDLRGDRRRALQEDPCVGEPLQTNGNRSQPKARVSISSVISTVDVAHKQGIQFVCHKVNSTEVYANYGCAANRQLQMSVCA